MAQQHNRKPVSVFVNAGDKTVTFTRRDKAEWDFPLFVNMPNGVREYILSLLNKQWQGDKLVATNNVTWEIPAGRIERDTISSGANAGKPILTVTITEDGLAQWLDQLEVTARGAVRDSVKAILEADAAKRGVKVSQTIAPEVDTDDRPF